jgi:TonB family protein
MKMSIKANREMISAFIDNELGAKERKKVEELIKSDARWKMEYKALKKTAFLMSRIEKLAVPEDMVKRVSTSISLSGTDRLKRRDSGFAMNFPRSPLFQYLATVVALALIVMSGSYFLLIHKNREAERYTSSLEKEQTWMDREVAKQDKELVKQGYRWYFLRLEQDGSFRIIHIGESKPKDIEESPAEKDEARRLQRERYASSNKPKETPRTAPTPPPELAKPAVTASAESKSVLPADDKRSSADEEQENLTAAAAKKSQDLQERAVKAKLENKGATAAGVGAAKSELQATAPGKPAAKKDVQTPASGQESSDASRIAKNKKQDDNNLNEKVITGPSTKRYRTKQNLPITILKEETISGESEKLPVPPQPEYIPNISVKHDGFIKKPVLKVMVELRPDGSVTNVEIISGSGNGWLDTAVKRALMKARFSKPVKTGTKGPVRFELKIEVK